MQLKIEYAQAAQAACAHVYKVCPLGSANRPNVSGKTMALAEEALIREKKDFDRHVEATLKLPLHSMEEKHLLIIRLLADVAERAKAGNCQEMAAVAFLFLLAKGIFPIELVSVKNHTFVIVGRDSKTPIDTPEEWNKEAVICDPWYRDYTRNAGQGFFSKAESISDFRQYINFKDISIGYAQYEQKDVKEVPTIPLDFHN